MHDKTYPGESEEYRTQRDHLLQAEVELRAKLEEVAQLRRELPPGGLAQNYVFESVDGEVGLHDLLKNHDSVVVYSFMFGGQQKEPCPMCSAFIDSVVGQIQHIEQRTKFAVVARSPIETLHKLALARGWSELTWLSAAQNTYPLDYHSEMPEGSQVPMCNVFTHHEGEIHHFWGSELFFAPTDTHPRHIDLLWPLWHFFDITPKGRESFMPSLNYR